MTVDFRPVRSAMEKTNQCRYGLTIISPYFIVDVCSSCFVLGIEFFLIRVRLGPIFTSSRCARLGKPNLTKNIYTYSSSEFVHKEQVSLLKDTIWTGP
jgi:hypothetical protein